MLPALVLFSVKFVSLILAANFLRLSFSWEGSGIVFSSFPNFYKANLVSNGLLLLTALLGFFLSLVRLHFFTDFSSSPIFSARLVSFGLESLIQPVRQSYLKALVWLVLAGFIVLSLFIQGFLGLTPFSLAAVGFSLLILGIFLLVFALERDLIDDDKSGDSVLIEEVFNA